MIHGNQQRVLKNEIMRSNFEMDSAKAPKPKIGKFEMRSSLVVFLQWLHHKLLESEHLRDSRLAIQKSQLVNTFIVETSYLLLIHNVFVFFEIVLSLPSEILSEVVIIKLGGLRQDALVQLKNLFRCRSHFVSMWESKTS